MFWYCLIVSLFAFNRIFQVTCNESNEKTVFRYPYIVMMRNRIPISSWFRRKLSQSGLKMRCRPRVIDEIELGAAASVDREEWSSSYLRLRIPHLRPALLWSWPVLRRPAGLNRNGHRRTEEDEFLIIKLCATLVKGTQSGNGGEALKRLCDTRRAKPEPRYKCRARNHEPGSSQASFISYIDEN